MRPLSGLAIAPWNVLAGGKIRSDEEEARRKESGEKGRQMLGPAWERSADERKVCAALEKVAQEVGAKSLNSVAIAYVMQKTRFVFPIIGGRKVEHLMSNLEALDISLSPAQIASLESVVPFDKGFPYKYFVSSFWFMRSSRRSLTTVLPRATRRCITLRSRLWATSRGGRLQSLSSLRPSKTIPTGSRFRRPLHNKCMQ